MAGGPAFPEASVKLLKDRVSAKTRLLGFANTLKRSLDQGAKAIDSGPHCSGARPWALRPPSGTGDRVGRIEVRSSSRRKHVSHSRPTGWVDSQPSNRAARPLATHVRQHGTIDRSAGCSTAQTVLAVLRGHRDGAAVSRFCRGLGAHRRGRSGGRVSADPSVIRCRLIGAFALSATRAVAPSERWRASTEFNRGKRHREQRDDQVASLLAVAGTGFQGSDLPQRDIWTAGGTSPGWRLCSQVDVSGGQPLEKELPGRHPIRPLANLS